MISNFKSQTTKIFTDSYLYQAADYNREIMNYVMSAERINKDSDDFSDIAYQVKMRQINSSLIKVLNSDKIVLCIGKKAMPRPFKVFRITDIKSTSKEKKVFIDCTDLITLEAGGYRCKNIAILLSYIISAMTYTMYYEIGDKLVRNTTLVQSGAEAFVDMMIYVLGYLKFPITYSDNKEKISYVLSMYFQRCILCKTDENAISQMSKKISKLDARKCEYYDSIFYPFYGDKNYININEFILKFAEVFLEQDPNSTGTDKLTSDVLVQRWMYAFGPGTYLGLELFPPFASILTDCYVGAYLNQQNTIEKIVGSNVAEFTNSLLSIGSDNA